jgi:hypothetical protein
VALSLEVRKTTGFSRSHWRNTTDVPWSNLRGLDSNQLDRILSAVKFEILRDPGTLICQGRTGLGRANGTFTFEPNPAFVRQLDGLGYGAPTDEQLFRMLMHDVTLEFARNAVEYRLGASTKDLIDMRAHGVNDGYLERVRASGYSVTARQLIDFKNHGVSPEFLSKVKASGFSFTAREVIQLRNHGVSAEFLEAAKDSGYGRIDAAEVVELRNHGIDPGYLRALSQHGLSPEPREITSLRDHGVTPDYLRELKEAGYEKLAVGEVIDLKNHGVPTAFVKQAWEAGFDFTTQELIHMRSQGVDAAYLRRIKASGFGNLTADQIVKLRQHGVD